MHFYFEPQTGLVRFKPATVGRSNFYSYRLPINRLPAVNVAISKAEVATGGLSYPEGFIEQLEEWDVGSCRCGGLTNYDPTQLCPRCGKQQRKTNGKI